MGDVGTLSNQPGLTLGRIPDAMGGLARGGGRSAGRTREGRPAAEDRGKNPASRNTAQGSGRRNPPISPQIPPLRSPEPATGPGSREKRRERPSPARDGQGRIPDGRPRQRTP